MMKFSDNYIKWGVTLVLVGAFGFPLLLIVEYMRGQVAKDQTVYLILIVATFGGFIPLILGLLKDIAYRTVFVDEEGDREKVLGKVKKEYAWDAVVDCGVCSRWVGSYWQYLVFFSDKPVTQKARYGREKKKGATVDTFITFPLCTDALHAIHSYAPPEIIEMFEGEYHPGNFQALQNMLANYRKEPRCLLPDAQKQAPPR